MCGGFIYLTEKKVLQMALGGIVMRKEQWYNKYKNDNRKFYFDNSFKKAYDLIRILSEYYESDSSFYKIELWLDIAEVGESCKLRKIDRVIARVR